MDIDTLLENKNQLVTWNKNNGETIFATPKKRVKVRKMKESYNSKRYVKHT